MKKKINSLIFIFSLLMISCTQPVLKPGQQTELPMELFGREGSNFDNLNMFNEYKIMTGDVLDLLFHFNVANREFRLLPQDLIEVKFPDVPDLNDTQRIRPDGKISFPYIGEVKVDNFSPEELQAKLKELFSSILKNPEVHVIIREYGAKIEELKKSITNSARGQSKLINVRADGYASFPIIGELKVAGLTFRQIHNVINNKYHKITEDLHVDLLLHQTAGAKICVLGAVDKPGFHPITRPVSIVEAISMANGFNEDAKLKSVVVMKRDGDKMRYKIINVDKILNGEQDAQHTFISINDIVFIPRMPISHINQIARYIQTIFGWEGRLTFSYNKDF